MSHFTRSLPYKCCNDCQQMGCPGHTLELDYFNTVDTVTCKIDGMHCFTLDDGAWSVLLKLEQQMYEELTRPFTSHD